MRPAIAEPLSIIGKAWNRFWFLPSDPTPLGLIRIIAGAIVLYVHLAYCLELTEFFGPRGWWSQDMANRERTGVLYPLSPLTWDKQPQALRLPETPERRHALFEFLRRLPDAPSERIARLVVISTIYQKLDEITERRRLFSEFASLPIDQRSSMRRELRDVGQIIPIPPSFFVFLEEAEGLITLLAPAPSPAFDAVLDWFQDLPPGELVPALEFIEKLPKNRTERLKVLDEYEFWNIDPRTAYATGKTVFSPWFHLTDPAAMKVVHGLVLIVMFLFMIGWATRVTSVLTWLAALGYMHRTPPIMYGIDTLMAVVLFYLMIGPSGAALSVDRLRARFRAARALAKGPAPWAEAMLAGPRPSAHANFTLRLLQIHFCFIYAASGLAKLKGVTWWNHTAGWMALVNPGFSLVYRHWFESLVLMIAEFRPLLALITGGFVVFTIALETTLPLLIWSRLRPLMIIGSVCLHTGIAILMGLTPFGLLMMTVLLAFFPAAVLRRPPTWIIRPGESLTIRYDPAKPDHQRLIARIRALDIASQVTLQPMTIAKVSVVGKDDLAKCLCRSLVLVQAVYWLPGMTRVFKA